MLVFYLSAANPDFSLPALALPTAVVLWRKRSYIEEDDAGRGFEDDIYPVDCTWTNFTAVGVTSATRPCHCQSALSLAAATLIPSPSGEREGEASMSSEPLRPKRVCVVGAGAAGLACAWSLSKHTDKFDVSAH